MTDAEDDIDDPPEPTGPYHTGLWGEARHWVGQLLRVWGNVKEIALIGISRRSALRCRSWLWSIEAIVRRLILAAALAFDLSRLKPRAAAKRRSPRPIKPEPEPSDLEPRRPSSAFRLLASTGGASARRAPPAVRPGGHRHLVLTADTLLSLGANKPKLQTKPKRATALRRPHPLDRLGRLSRFDPLYRSDPEKEAESYRRYMFGPFRKYGEFDPPPPKREVKHRDIHNPWYRGDDSLAEHHRIEAEWQRLIPAPSLAGRIMALHRVMQNPEIWIERAARLLQRAPSLIPLLRDAERCSFRRHRRDDGPKPPGEFILWEAHSQLLGIDTS